MFFLTYPCVLLKALTQWVKRLYISTAVYMSEWERSKPKPLQPAEEESESTEPKVPEEDKAGETSEETSSHQPPASAGVTYELCAGLVDKPNLSLEEIARQEVLEECGYDVPVTKLRKITSYRWEQIHFSSYSGNSHHVLGKHFRILGALNGWFRFSVCTDSSFFFIITI